MSVFDESASADVLADLKPFYPERRRSRPREPTELTHATVMALRDLAVTDSIKALHELPHSSRARWR